MFATFGGLGNTNTAVGATALFNNTDGDPNNAVGFNAVGANMEGLFNNAIGFKAVADNVSGAGNVAVGDSASGLWMRTANGKRFAVHATEKLTAFVELEAAIRAATQIP